LPATGRPDDAHRLAVAHGEVQVAERHHGAFLKQLARLVDDDLVRWLTHSSCPPPLAPGAPECPGRRRRGAGIWGTAVRRVYPCARAAAIGAGRHAEAVFPRASSPPRAPVSKLTATL